MVRRLATMAACHRAGHARLTTRNPTAENPDRYQGIAIIAHPSLKSHGYITYQTLR
jgi:hypothetical protein